MTPNYEHLFLSGKLQKEYHVDIIKRYCAFFKEAAPETVAFYEAMLQETPVETPVEEVVTEETTEETPVATKKKKVS